MSEIHAQHRFPLSSGRKALCHFVENSLRHSTICAVVFGELTAKLLLDELGGGLFPPPPPSPSPPLLLAAHSLIGRGDHLALNWHITSPQKTLLLPLCERLHPSSGAPGLWGCSKSQTICMQWPPQLTSRSRVPSESLAASAHTHFDRVPLLPFLPLSCSS